MRATPYHSFEEHCEAVTWMARAAVRAVPRSRTASMPSLKDFIIIPSSAKRVALTLT